MNAANDIAEFLTTRRAKITPEQAGLPSYGQRRVPGPAPRGGRVAGRRQRRVLPAPGARPGQRRLRARARRAGPGAAARRRRARAPLRPGPRRQSGRSRSARRPAKTRVRPVVQRLLDQIRRRRSSATCRCDYLAANALGRALYAPVFESPEQPANSARFTFLDPAARDFYPDWERARLGPRRARCARRPAATPMTATCQDLIGELSTRSDEFRVRWAAHNVRFHRTGTKRLHHPIVGELELSYETLTLDADDGLTHGALHRRTRLRLTAGAGPAGQLDGDARPRASPRAREH